MASRLWTSGFALKRILNFNLPKIYPITDTGIAKISHAEQVQKLIACGAEIIQLRDKYHAPRDFYEAAKAALAIARKRRVKIIINDRADIALALKADGVHLGQDDLPPDRARKILGERAIIGFSTHNLEQAVAAIKFPIDYLAIGPVHATRTKKNSEETVGIEGVKRVREAVGDFPLVAIGGITAKNFREVLRGGANSVAIISDLFGDTTKISDKMRKFLAD